jgi:hypothetical protein
MITNKKEKIINSKEPISFDAISKRISELTLSLGASIKEVLNAETNKLKIKTGTIFANQFEAEIKEIQVTYKKHLKKTPHNLEDFLVKLNTRANELNEMVYKIKTYPIKSITNQLKKEAEEQGIEHTKIKTFVNEITNSLLNLVVEYTIQFEEYIMDQLCQKEMERINIDFFTDNIALKIISSQKQQHYIALLYKGIKAYYHDFKAHVNTESSFFKLIEKFFLKLIVKIERIGSNKKPEITQKGNQKNDFPSHIFKNFDSFQLFEELAKNATNQEEIGFYFRQMSEKENPQLIVAKEITFRTWFNVESEHEIELNNQIKTFDRIMGLSKKHKFYELIKQKYNSKNYKFVV